MNNKKSLFEQFAESPATVKTMVVAVIGVWGMVVAMVIIGAVLFLERPGQALQPTPGAGVPAVILEPTLGPPGTIVSVRGQGWQPGQLVLIYLVPPGQTEPPNYAAAGSTADETGGFVARVVIPNGPEWETDGLATLIARASTGGAAAQTLFGMVAPERPSVTPSPSVEPSPTGTPEPTATPTSVPPTPQPGVPTAAAITDLNIRGGPSTAYAVLGVLRAGQSSEITGASSDRAWWQIKFSGAADGRGWVAANYVTAQNTQNVPVVQAPPLPTAPPPPPPPTATPVVIRDWRGEYYTNPNLSGSPVLVRDDAAVNFDWGVGAPASSLPSDNFSVRWTRSLNFAAGTYHFSARADDGVRLWVDNSLVIDQWHDSSATTYGVDLYLNDGAHSLRMEYYEHSGGALAQLGWDRQEGYPDWKGEYYTNPNLNGSPVLVRNDSAVDFDWGTGAPASGLPSDNFSVRWTRSLGFSAGNYHFSARVDDGVRLWVDNNLVIDQWHDSSATTYSADLYLNEGNHSLRMEYYDRGGDALAHLSWERQDSYPDWKAEYFDNRNLDGDPVLVRNESKIDHDWGGGSPGSQVPSDNFSARWTRRIDFEAGTYLVQVRVDDGVRLWVDDTLLIDSWRDGNSRLVEAEANISGGKHRVKVEYYERRGNAQIKVSYQRQGQTSNQPPEAVPGGPYQVDEGALAVFDGTRSSDPDGSIAKYEWDLNYDGSRFDVDASGPTASTRYADGPAILAIALRVTDDKGAAQTVLASVQVRNLPPAVEAGGPYAGQAGSAVSLAGTANDPGPADQASLSYAWDFGDGTTASGPNVSHVYSQPGTYTARLTVTDKDGGQGSDTAGVQVSAPNQAPTAAIGGPAQGLVGETLTFSGSGSSDSDGTIVSYAWDFGDTTTGSGVNVTHSYAAAGTYTLRLTVTDDDGLTGQATYAVQINPPAPSNQPPVAAIGGPAQGLEGETLTFSGSGSTDSDGNIVSYAWDFGDTTTGAGVNVTHSYAAAGDYQVRLTVTDDDGASAQATHALHIDPPAPANQPPVAAIAGPAQGLVGDALSFSGGGSTDSDGTIVSYAWDLGDGTGGSGADVTHSYAAPGTYTLILTVTDDDGLTGQATHALQIDTPVPPNQPPAAAISGPAQGLAGQALSFSGSGSTDSDGTIVTYAWSFGDGAAATGADVTHSYATPGGYTIVLTVTDDDGAAGQATQAVQIDPPPPNQPPSAVISGVLTAVVSQTVTFDAGSSSDSDGTIVGYAWTFGDGATASGVSVSHVYTQVGSYPVGLTVTDDDGATATSGYTIQIVPPAQAKLGQPPGFGAAGLAAASLVRGARFLRAGLPE